MRVSFEKYQGLGNDFLIVEHTREMDTWMTIERVRQLCDRRFGVGGDGVLLVGSGLGAASMRVLNADGSIPEMCGNGLRCVARYLATKEKLSGPLTIATDAGKLECTLEGGYVRSELGHAKIVDERVIQASPYGALKVAVVDIGNPHAILLRADGTFWGVDEASVLSIGPAIERAPVFPERTNVEFVRINDRTSLELVVWERGVGRTLACGTGAGATAFYSASKGFTDWAETAVDLPGGRLFVTPTPGGKVMMRGPAEHVYSGSLEIE